MKSKLNPNARKLVRALRSGKYKQCRGALGKKKGDRESFCCLGVACEVYNESVPVSDRVSKIIIYGSIRYNDEAFVLPSVVQKWLGLRGEDGRFDNGSLAGMNDGMKKRFSTIANIIESQPEGLFSK